MRWWLICVSVSVSITVVSPSVCAQTQAQRQTRIPKFLADVQILESKQQHTKALQLLDSEIRRNPSNLQAIWWRTRMLVNLDNVDKILDDCNMLIKADPKAERFPLIYTYRATVYQNFDETAKAMQDLDQTRRLNQIEEHYYICRFLCLQTLGKFDEAIGQVDQLVSLKTPALAHWLCKRANLFEATNRPDKALADLSRAIELKPKEKVYWTSRARLLEHLKRYDEAISDYGHLLQLDASNETNYFKRGKLYLAKGKYKLALADLDKSISLDPVPSATAYECRAQIYDKLGDREKAKKDRVSASQVR